MSSLADKVMRLHAALDDAGVPHAFGGALALAWCTGRARGTIDIDLNVFVGVAEAPSVLDALPDSVGVEPIDLATIERDGQVRLWWDTTPVDLFFNTTEFHEQTAQRARRQEFAGGRVPFLSCTDLAVFKAFFDRTQDWADLEAMAEAGTLDVDRLVGVLVRYLGSGDPRIVRVRSLTS